MESASPLTLADHFATLDDPRVERTKLHPLLTIVTIAICAVVCGAETWDDIEAFGEDKAAWFATFLDLPHRVPSGCPSHDTFNRVFAALDPVQFQTCFVAWMQAVAGVLPAQVIALDGKTLRGSHDAPNGKQAIHLVSAWATANRVVLAQVQVDSKSNEITALPEILRQLALTGCLVSIDAMGCQRAIAQQILDQGGDYLLGLKGNQETLATDVTLSFTVAQADDFAGIDHDRGETWTKGHGRIEHRQHWVIDDASVLTWLQEQHAWPGLQAIGMVRAERWEGTKHTSEDRYYLVSRVLSASEFGAGVRSHWGIENKVHWVLDVSFHEDQSRVRAGHAAANMGVLRHIALNLLRQVPKTWGSIRGKRLRAGWNHDFLVEVLRTTV